MEDSKKNNLHKSLRFVFVIAQIFGFFPIQGVLQQDVSFLSFSWWSLRLFSSIFTSLGGYFIALGHVIHMAMEGYDQFEMNGIIFYCCGATSGLLFIRIAKEWPKIMKKWREIDENMQSYGWPKNLNKRLTLISTTFLLLEAVEHVSIQANKLIVATQCRGSLSKGLEHFFINMSFPHVFNLIGYSPWKGVLLQVLNTRMAFSWTFLDLFIILMSCALASRFKQINNKVCSMRELNVKCEKSWEAVREDYNKLCELCYFLDDEISWLVLVSFGNNLYFIIIQIFGTIDLGVTVLERAYFFVSLGLLILRIATICFYGSWINEESKTPMYILTSSPEELCNREVERFIENIRYKSIGFTGKKLFIITNGLILKIASAIVTYELVLIQFNKNSIKDSVKTSKNSIC